MSGQHSKDVIDRMAAMRREMGAENFATYAFLALGILAWSAPEVVEFAFDRANERIDEGPKP